MERNFQVSEVPGRVEITFRGPVSFLDRIHAIGVVLPLLIERGSTGILIDYTNAWVHEPSSVDYERLEARLRSEPYLMQCMVALVNPPEFHAIPTESIGRDIGYPVRRFGSRRAAIAWLD